MGLANKESILAAIDWDYDEFDVAGWGTIRIRALSAKERLEFAADFAETEQEPRDGFRFLAQVIMASIVDENGGRVFEPGTDPELLLAKNWNRLKEVADRILAFNGMADTTVEGIEKN